MTLVDGFETRSQRDERQRAVHSQERYLEMVRKADEDCTKAAKSLVEEAKSVKDDLCLDQWFPVFVAKIASLPEEFGAGQNAIEESLRELIQIAAE